VSVLLLYYFFLLQVSAGWQLACCKCLWWQNYQGKIIGLSTASCRVLSMTLLCALPRLTENHMFVEFLERANFTFGH